MNDAGIGQIGNQPLGLTPEESGFLGRLQRLEQVIELRVGQPLAIQQPVDAGRAVSHGPRLMQAQGQGASPSQHLQVGWSASAQLKQEQIGAATSSSNGNGSSRAGRPTKTIAPL